MTLRTITYDDAIYKLVPVVPNYEITMAGIKAHALIPSRIDCLNYYVAYLAAVPDTLPGVIEHDGEPVAVAIPCEYKTRDGHIDGKSVTLLCLDGTTEIGQNELPLFTHPEPAQSVERQELSDDVIKECVDAIDFSQMVTADDIFYMIARAAIAKDREKK